MKGAQPHTRQVAALLAEQTGHAFLHLARRLVGEGHRQHAARVRSLGQKAGQPTGNHAGLARTRAGNHQQRLRRIGHRLDLTWVQFAGEGFPQAR